MKDYTFLQQKYIVPGYPNRGLTILSGDNVYVVDDRGRRYLDMMSNFGVTCFGYRNTSVIEALRRQMCKTLNVHSSFANDTRAQAAQMLVRRCGKPYTQTYWANSGAEAVEAALKFAVLKTEKKRFVSAKNSYHGKTLGALSASANSAYRAPFEPLLWDFVHVDFADSDAIERAINPDTAAVILEPIQGESGVIVPVDDYLRRVAAACRRHNVLLILDEIQTGTGRTGSFLASHAAKVHADMVCLGKGLAGGLPVGATVVTRAVAEAIPKSVHTSTFGGNPLTCAGVCIALELLDESMLHHITDIGNYFLKQLRTIESHKIADIRGKGLMIGVEVTKERNEVLQQLQKEKILAIPAGYRCVRFLPPYSIEKKHVDRVVEVLRRVL